MGRLGNKTLATTPTWVTSNELVRRAIAGFDRDPTLYGRNKTFNRKAILKPVPIEGECYLDSDEQYGSLLYTRPQYCLVIGSQEI